MTAPRHLDRRVEAAALIAVRLPRDPDEDPLAHAARVGLSAARHFRVLDDLAREGTVPAMRTQRRVEDGGA